ncbi:MAG: nucleoside monophosphate kinase [Puniceicoccaceae bacterium]|nr:MAG: nucleoside monophosphate kinase [Puniceicoccaceae bacterium]
MTQPSPKQSAASRAPSVADLEVKDPSLIFNSIWDSLEAEISRENLVFPKELILLGGAPGAGKGTNTSFIMDLRGLTCEPIVVSKLLDSPAARKTKDRGGMVGDREVIEIVLRTLLKPQYRDGAILDGFPRTPVQVEALKRLYGRMVDLRREFYGTNLGDRFRQPIIHIMVLFIDEKESIARQLHRGRKTREHNEEVRRTGIGELLEERATDNDEASARRRYQVFKEQTYDALQSLRTIFHYHFINAQGSLDEVRGNIVKELQYQSSIELDPRTYDAFRSLPVASQLAQHARQDLVKRLDHYEFHHTEIFHRIIKFIETRILPIIVRHAITGRAHVNSEDPIFEDPLALAMLIDIFSERGFHAVVDLHRQEIPERIDLKTGKIHCRTKKVWRIQIHFKGSEIRRGA